MAIGMESEAGWRSDREWLTMGIDARTSPTPALRGRQPGRKGWTGADEGERLATFLAWFSIGLGAAQVLAPRVMTRMVGAKDSRTTATIMQAAGLREIGHGVGILANPKSKEWIGSRVAGDMLDLALLGVTGATGDRKDRTLLATLAVMGVTALDILATEERAQSRKAPSPEVMDQPGTPVLKSITVEAPVEEVFRFWHSFENFPRFMKHLKSVQDLGNGRSRWVASGPNDTSVEWEATTTLDRENELIAWESDASADIYNSGSVRFRAAAGGRGTIVTIEMRYSPPGGSLGSAFLKLIRHEPGQMIGDDLRRFKQIMELGEVVLSDATAVDGPHPAQPAERHEIRAR